MAAVTAALVGAAAATAAVLPPHSAAVVAKTPAVTAMVGAQTTINNQLKTDLTTAPIIPTIATTLVDGK
jgi:hypothetical protein